MRDDDYYEYDGEYVDGDDDDDDEMLTLTVMRLYVRCASSESGGDFPPRQRIRSWRLCNRHVNDTCQAAPRQNGTLAPL